MNEYFINLVKGDLSNYRDLGFTRSGSRKSALIFDKRENRDVMILLKKYNFIVIFVGCDKCKTFNFKNLKDAVNKMDELNES